MTPACPFMSPQEQYAFIHDVVLESVTCGDTQITARDLKFVISRLKSKDQTICKTQFEEQFKVCSVTSTKYEVHCVELPAISKWTKFHFRS